MLNTLRNNTMIHRQLEGIRGREGGTRNNTLSRKVKEKKSIS